MEEQVSAIEEAFETIDVNGDGLISVQEFKTLLNNFGEDASDEEIEAKFRIWDIDGDGSINFFEFLAAVAKIITDVCADEGRMRSAFRLFDRDDNGFITPAELSAVMADLHGGEKLNPKEIEEMILEADMDRDGKISFSEFKKLMSN